MKVKEHLIFVIFCMLFVIQIAIGAASSEVYNNTYSDNGDICAVYITGIGCPNCAVTDPVVFSEFTANYPNLVIIEYEILYLDV